MADTWAGEPAAPARPAATSPRAAIEVRRLTKTFGAIRAIDDLSFSVTPGRVTGFLGPNGAGKTTTLRILLGLVTPTSGTATVQGRRYRDLSHPMRTVGAALEATGFHSGRRARDHLRVLTAAAELPDSRADEVLEQVGMTAAAGRRVGEFSMGMRQRLALAAALLGDPEILLLDEPANGLDPEGIAWLRGFLRHLAGEGRTVLVSSHVLAEVAQTVDDVVIIHRGRLVRQAALEELTGPQVTVVRSPTRSALLDALRAAGHPADSTASDRPASDRTASDTPTSDSPASDPSAPDSALRISGLTPAQVGAIAHRAGIELHELRAEATDLEATFFALTADQVMPS